MIVPAFSQGLYGRLRQLAAADWQRYVAHPFVQQLASGTLAENAFRRYLTQDYLFLIHFARSYALLVSKLRTLPEMRAATASMNAALPFVAARWLVVLARKSAGYPPLPSSCGKVAR